ncbi:SDR family oxidoreductase [Paracoccus tegillarcae]|uniref:NAD(P)-dependent oxidoreductase n=1 Tax=Paracoccus tegillarcae TaxID=1529068 RepID=A0A2K9EY15_9RHOB|nr:SDR family oxidoreductase [Paracoccus tegillarcae]AUH32982.1 NAD(P)-dependent oxidoreductase [Paracoccus tegillarcae]
MRLKDKAILITAAGQGMGRASALACAAEGANVWATDRDGALLDGLADHGIRTQALDVTDHDAIAALASELPPLDGLFNCAGIVVNGSLETCTVEDWDLSFAVNINAMFHMTRAVMPGLLERAGETGTAAILNMASVAGSVRGLPNRCAYGASKAAVIGLTKSIAADYVGSGLRANCLCPGTVDTPSLRGRIASAADPVQAEKDFIARQPMGRIATVDDMTPVVIYLLSDESRFVSGQAVSVDGGMTI